MNTQSSWILTALRRMIKRAKVLDRENQGMLSLENIMTRKRLKAKEVIKTRNINQRKNPLGTKRLQGTQVRINKHNEGTKAIRMILKVMKKTIVVVNDDKDNQLEDKGGWKQTSQSPTPCTNQGIAVAHILLDKFVRVWLKMKGTALVQMSSIMAEMVGVEVPDIVLREIICDTWMIARIAEKSNK